jgi:hypothetical protein
MQRSSATVVCVIGTDAAGLLRGISAANVSVASIAADLDPLERAQAATTSATRVTSRYFVHDADPLASIANAWTRLFDGEGPIGEVEVAVSATLSRARAGSLELPDYYVVTEADTMAPTRRHWFFGVLHGAAPQRVVPAGHGPHDVLDALGTLRPGRWWPPLDELLDRIEQRAPEAPPEPVTSAQGQSGLLHHSGFSSN